MKKIHEQLDFVIKEVLKESGNKVARTLGLHQGLVNQCLKGSTKPPVEFMHKFCNYYGISANWLTLDIGPIRLADIDSVAGERNDICEKTMIQLKNDLSNIRKNLNELCEKYEL